jgi:hypothetical protein
VQRDSREAARIADAGGVAQAELTAVVETPAFDGPVIEKGAGVTLTSGDLQRGATKGNRVEEFTHFIWVIASVSVIANAKLTVLVVAPTLHPAVKKHSAGVLIADAD